MPTNTLDLTNHNISDENFLGIKLDNRIDWETIILSENPLKSINALSTQQNLRVLYLSDTLIADLANVPTLESLEVLHLSDTPLLNIATIATKLKNLKALYLTGSPIVNLTGIQGLIHLEILSLSGTPLKKQSLVELSSLKNLKKLYLQEIELDTDTILAFKELPHLEYLEINYEPELQFAKDELFKDIAKQKYPEKEQTRNFSPKEPSCRPATVFFSSPPTSRETEASRPQKYTPAGMQESIQQKLDLNRNAIGEFDLELILRVKPDIESLDISETPITDLSLFNTLSLPNLKEIDISLTNIQDLEPLRRIGSLKIIHANYVNISDKMLLEISALSKLEELYISYSNIGSVEQLKKLINLKILNISGNEAINDISSLSKLNDLKVLHLQGTEIFTEQQLSPIRHIKFEKLSVNEDLSTHADLLLDPNYMKNKILSPACTNEDDGSENIEVMTTMYSK